MEKDTQKLWNLTDALNDDQQHAPRVVLLKKDAEIFTGKKATYLLVVSYRTACSISQGERKANIRTKTKEQLQKQSPAPRMASEFSIHELSCALKQLKKNFKKYF